MNQATTKPVCVVFGPSDFGRRESLRRVIERELQGGDEAVNVVRYEGKQAELADVLDEVRTYSLMGGRRVVVIDDAESFVSKNRQALERYVASPSHSGCLVLVCSSFDARTKLYKAIRTIGELIECKAVKGPELIEWLMSTAQDTFGKKLERRAAMRLTEHVGTSEASLHLEVDKLASYIGERKEITFDDVDALVGHYREQTVFAVMDAMADGNAELALNEWQQVVQTDRAAPGRAVAGLAWGVRRLIEAKTLLNDGASAFSVAKRFWTDAETLNRRLQHCSIPDLEDRLTDLLQVDLDSKTGSAAVPQGVERFIVKHSMAVRAR